MAKHQSSLSAALNDILSNTADSEVNIESSDEDKARDEVNECQDYEIVRTFLCAAAVPLNKLDKFRNLLEESAFSLSDKL